MYKIFLKGLFGIVEVNRIFKHKIIAENFAKLLVFRFNEICDYEIKEV